VETGLLTLEGMGTKYVYILCGELEKAKRINLSGGLNYSPRRSCKMHLTREIIWRKTIKQNGKLVLRPTFYLKWEKIRMPAVNNNKKKPVTELKGGCVPSDMQNCKY
jgi:hypothetical protein